MAANLSVKNVPDGVAHRLRERARRNHRSLQGELLHILEQASEWGEAAEGHQLSVRELRERVLGRGYTTGDDATRWVRENRDSR